MVWTNRIYFFWKEKRAISYPPEVIYDENGKRDMRKIL